MPVRTILPPPDELIRLHEEERVPFAQIALDYGVTRQAVYDRIRRYREAKADPYVPWAAVGEHRGSDFEQAARAHGKWSKGEAVSDREKHLANQLRDTAALLGMVMTYGPLGYVWRDRLPSDVDILAAA